MGITNEYVKWLSAQSSKGPEIMKSSVKEIFIAAEPQESTISLIEVKTNLPTDAPFYDIVMLNQASRSVIKELSFQFQP